MKGFPKIAVAGILLVIIVTGIFWLEPGQSLQRGMVIATAVPVEVDLQMGDFGVDSRYIPSASIIAFHPGNEVAEPLILTQDFHSARSSQVSYDGTLLAFSGQKMEGDSWQIYILDLQSRELRQVTNSPGNCTDPTWLPDGRILFSLLSEEETAGPIHVLYRCETDGSSMERLMFHPNSAIASSVFQDGRILVQSQQKHPELGYKKLLAMRTDGTKAELFFDPDPGSSMLSRALETTDGRMYFVEKRVEGSAGGNLVSISKGNPMSYRRNHSVGVDGEFYSVYPAVNGDLYVSYRQKPADLFGIGLFDVQNNSIRDITKMNDKFHLLEPVLLESRRLPMKLPEIVDHAKEKGTLLCLDTNLSADSVTRAKDDDRRTDKVQVYGLEGLLGEISVEKDGSFYIEVDADTPVRFQTVDAEGELLHGPSAWIWVRPNEKRSCIGCHEDRALAPENKVPQALYAGMVSIPEGIRTQAVDVKGKHMKEYEE